MRERVGRTSTAVEVVGEDTTAVGEAVAWIRRQWRQRGIEAVAWTQQRWRRCGVKAHAEEEWAHDVNLTAIREAVGEDPTTVEA
jgi:hypothetical protein